MEVKSATEKATLGFFSCLKHTFGMGFQHSAPLALI